MMISIIIPAYNAEKYIRQAMESIYSQSYQGEKEIIVIDDGSTDSTAEIVKSFPEVHYHYQENAGEAAARNKGMSLARGKYITWLDADDWYEPEKLEKQIAFLDNNPQYDFVYCDFTTYDEATKEYGILKAEPFIEGCNNFLASILFRQIIPGIACIMMRRECIDAGCHYDEQRKYAPDYSFCLQLLMKGFTPGYLTEPLYGYRRHSGNITNAHHHQRTSEIAQVQALGVEKLEEIVKATTFSEEEQNILLAKILLKINNPTASLNILEKRSYSVMSPRELFYAGNCKYLQKDYLAAIDCYNAALDHHRIQLRGKLSPELYNNSACAWLLHGDKKIAEEQFNHALQLRPNYMDPQLNLDLLQSTNNKQQTTTTATAARLTLFELRPQLQNYL